MLTNNVYLGQIIFFVLQAAVLFGLAWLAHRAETSALGKYALCAVLGLGSIYIGLLGSSIYVNASVPHFEIITVAFLCTAVATALTILPSSRRLLSRLTRQDFTLPIQTIGLWFFIAVMMFNIISLTLWTETQTNALPLGTAGLYVLCVREMTFVVAALIGAGLFTRRSLADVLVRLGLDFSQLKLAMVLPVVGVVIMGMVLNGSLDDYLKRADPDTQIKLLSSVRALVLAEDGLTIGVVALAALVGFVTSFGEESLFRGLLQPAFGVLPTTVLFTVIHVQYGVSLSLGLIFVLGLAFAFLRRKYSTTSSFFAHAAYNTLAILVSVGRG